MTGNAISDHCKIQKYNDKYESLLVKISASDNKKELNLVCSYLIKEHGVKPYIDHCKIL